EREADTARDRPGEAAERALHEVNGRVHVAGERRGDLGKVAARLVLELVDVDARLVPAVTRRALDDVAGVLGVVLDLAVRTAHLVGEILGLARSVGEPVADPALDLVAGVLGAALDVVE